MSSTTKKKSPSRKKPSAAAKKRKHATNHSPSPSELTLRPPLEKIPARIKELVNLIKIGGCTSCGCTECHRVQLRSSKNYRCNECKWEFAISSKSKHRNKTYRDRTFEGKQRLLALVKYANEEIVKREMEADRVEFEQQMVEMKMKLSTKRRNISKLLDIPLGVEDEEIVQPKKKKRGRSPKKEEEAKGGTDVQQVEDPLKEMILLLRNETPQLEGSVSRLLHYYRNTPSVVNSNDNAGEDATKAANESSVDEKQESKEDDPVDIVTDQPSRCNKAGYQLASRFIQDDGEEIEIYEKVP